MDHFGQCFFNSKGDFSLATIDEHNLVQQKVSKAIDKSFSVIVTKYQKKEYDKFAYTSIILHISNFVLQKVGKHDSTKKL